MDVISLILSIISIFISGIVAYIVHFHRGKLRMTQPSIIALTYDAPVRTPKIVLSSLFYSTSERGKVIENLFLRVIYGKVDYNFNRWFYDKENTPYPGGLFVNKEGKSNYHHFLLSQDDVSSFRFRGGEYSIKIYAQLVGNHKPILLRTIKFLLDNRPFASINDTPSALLYWNPETAEYELELKTSNAQNWIDGTLARIK
jgi:hypothetical protein